MLAIELVCATIMAIGAVAWTVRLRQLGRLGGADPATAMPRVSVIVPARDEAHNLPALLASLRALDPAPAEIIIVDDHSSDGTGDLARAAGVTVVTPPPLPDSWVGKSWACQAGAAVATGELLLFSDADTVHAPDSLGRAVARMQRTGATLLSVVPTHAVVAAWERLQGVFHLLLLVACGAGAANPRGERRFSIGQYLLFRRDAYVRLGGHAAVGHRIAEDLAFAEAVAQAGGRFELLHAPGLLTVRMYPEGLGGFWRGWRRSFREGLGSAGLGGGLETVAVIGWLLGAPLFAAWHGLAGEPLALAYLGMTGLAVATIAHHQRGLGAMPWWGALAYPLVVLAFVAISVTAVIDRARRAPVRWRGRSIAAALALLMVAAAPAPADAGKDSTTAKAKGKPKAKAYAVKVVTLTAQPALIKRARVAKADVADTLSTSMISLFLYATQEDIDVAGPPFARIIATDDPALVDVEAGIPVVKAARGAGDIEAAELPAGKAATVLHVGRHADLPRAQAALTRWLAQHKRKAAGPMWQVFLTNPTTQPDETKQKTKVFVPLVK